jgi:hypothetical protein
MSIIKLKPKLLSIKNTKSDFIMGRNMRRYSLAIVCLATVFVSGCVVQPTPITEEDVKTRVEDDLTYMFAGQEPVTKAITMEEAIARALKYNLDYRLKKMESALSFGLTKYANYDMLPQLITSAGYRDRNNDSGGSSIGIEDRVESLRPSTSEQQYRKAASAQFSWNALDFGVSYYRARQQADQFLIAEERRRKVVHTMIQDVRSAWWRAVAAQRLEEKSIDILNRTKGALAKSRQAEDERLLAPVLALNYQRALLDAVYMLNQRRQDLAFAKSELAALMSVPAGTSFRLADRSEIALPIMPADIKSLEEMALLQRPELREEDFKTRITADETRKQIVSMMPGLSFDYGASYDSNKYLYNNNWVESGVGISWNLMRLAALPQLRESREDQVATDQARRAALSMAVMTQVRVAIARYGLALTDYSLADQSASVDQRLADHTRASVEASLNNELEAIRTEARAVLGAYQRSYAYANAQIAFGRLYTTLGFDPLEDDFEGDNLAILSARVKNYMQKVRKNEFDFSSNLFNVAPAIVGSNLVGAASSVEWTVVGVNDVQMEREIKVLASKILQYYNLQESDLLGDSIELRLIVGAEQKSYWKFSMLNDDGSSEGSASYSFDEKPSLTYIDRFKQAFYVGVPMLTIWIDENEGVET